MPYPNYGIKVYKNGDYKAVNRYLRKIRGVEPACLGVGDNLSQTQIENLEKIISDIDEKMVPNVSEHYPMLYRGTGPLEFGRTTTSGLTKLIGKRRRWKAYTSTSDIKRCAEKYASGTEKGILLEIKTSPNVKYIDLKSYSELKHTKTEPEILLAHGTLYKITGVAAESRFVRVQIELI